MPLKDLLSVFDADARRQKAFDKTVTRLISRNQQHEERMACIEQLAMMDTPEANRALFRRWDMMADKKREDVAEKEYLLSVLVDKGTAILPFLREHNDRSTNVTWPTQVLRRIVDSDAVIEELLRVLKAEQERLAAFKPEKKTRLLQLLSDYDDPRVTPAVILSLDDFDETVRWEAAQTLSKVGDDRARDALVDRLANPDEDSARVRSALVAALYEGKWSVLDRKEVVTPHLGSDYRIGPRGNLIHID